VTDLSAKGTIFNIQRFSLHDGPGIRTTVFMKGCPLRCWWCHNPESQAAAPELMFRAARCIGCNACLAACEQGATRPLDGHLDVDHGLCTACGACVAVCYAEAREIMGREVTVAELLDGILRDVPFFEESGGGVTFSGGEPLYQPAFLLAILQACKAREIPTALDTCGLASWESLDAVRPYVDLFLYDLKLMDAERHRRFTGASNALILSNLRELSARGHRVHVRVPILPGINDDVENIGQLGEFLSSLPALDQVTLLAYHRTGLEKYNSLGMAYRLPAAQPPGEERMAEVAGTLAAYGLRVQPS
jgi:pyruvate formate lyase activating enzyme